MNPTDIKPATSGYRVIVRNTGDVFHVWPLERLVLFCGRDGALCAVEMPPRLAGVEVEPLSLDFLADVFERRAWRAR